MSPEQELESKLRGFYALRHRLLERALHVSESLVAVSESDAGFYYLDAPPGSPVGAAGTWINRNPPDLQAQIDRRRSTAIEAIADILSSLVWFCEGIIKLMERLPAYKKQSFVSLLELAKKSLDNVLEWRCDSPELKKMSKAERIIFGEKIIDKTIRDLYFAIPNFPPISPK